MSKKKIVYFCMEYGIHQGLNTYAGGLGILAGDILKAGKDNNYDITGIGILWGEGYTEQYVHEGKIINKYKSHNYNLVEDTDIEFDIKIGHHEIKCKLYRTEELGNAPLYLIDTNHEDNKKEYRDLTSRLYSGNQYQELMQQAILGRAGLKTLKELEIKPDIIHLNESDSVFAALEILKDNQNGADFQEALEKIKKKVRFTTHTPVSAGNPIFDYTLFDEIGLSERYGKDVLNWLSKYEFNTTLACLRMAGRTNAVAKRHLQTARNMWQKHDDISEIIGITNGVHLPTWQSKNIKNASSDEELWESHIKHKKFLKRYLNADFDIDKPLIGFARRITDYKRPSLIFNDEERVNKILADFNIIFTGKAHPDDTKGGEIVLDIYNKSQNMDSVYWIENYSIYDAINLIKGCDIWLSSPIPPKEACSTSTIKAASNGVLNISTPDGWWWEACEHGVNGWKFGMEDPIEDRMKQDWEDAQNLYDVLENEVLPLYRGNKSEWIEMMKESIKTAEKYSAKKLLEKYDKKLWK